MKKLILCLTLLLTSSAARANLWQGAGVHKSGHASLGGFGQLYFSPTEFQVFGQGMYGFGHGLQGELRLGLGSLPTYVGGFVKYQLVSGEVLSLAAWGGLHVQTNGALDFSLMASHAFSTVEIYFNPLISLPLVSGADLAVAFVPGFDLYVAKQLKLYVEFTLNATNYYNAGSAGVRYVL
jgi:hypothetical protein